MPDAIERRRRDAIGFFVYRGNSFFIKQALFPLFSLFSLISLLSLLSYFILSFFCKKEMFINFALVNVHKIQFLTKNTKKQ